MKIYTGRGDFGNTNLIGGSTVRKTDKLVEAYGEIDELNSHIGVLASMLDDNIKLKVHLGFIQNTLFDIGSMLADPKKTMGITVEEKEINLLQSEIDQYTFLLDEIQHFVLPGGSNRGSYAHLVRTVARRVERSVLEAADEVNLDQNARVYLNRLSDYFFTVARYLNNIDEKDEAFYKGTGEVFH